MKSKMNQTKKRMKNKKGINGNRSVKGGGRTRRKLIKKELDKLDTATGEVAKVTGNVVSNAFAATSYEKKFDEKVLEKISEKKGVIQNIEVLKETVTEFNSKIEKAHKQLDIFKNAYSKGKTIEPKLKANLKNFSDSHDKLDNTYNEFIDSNKIQELLITAMEKALKTRNTAEDAAIELENSGKVAQKAVSHAQKSVSDAKKEVSDSQKAVSDAKKNLEDANKKKPENPNTTETLALRNAEITLRNAQYVLINAETTLINEQTESAKTAATEFLNNVSLNEVISLYNIIEKIFNKYKQDKHSLNSILFDNYKLDMYELIDEKKKMYNQIFKYKKNYTKQEYETFFTTINNVDFTQYNNLMELYNNIVKELEKIYSNSKELLELANNINKYDLSSFEDLVPAPVTPITTGPVGDKKDAKAKAEESMKKVEQLKDQIKHAEKKAKEDEKKVKMIDERKITDIDIKFYKSNFKNKNPFPYYEQVVLNRTGIDVISDLYGVEELFPTFKEELQYLADPKKFIEDPENEYKFKPFKRKHIKIEHTKNDKSAPSLDFFE